VKLAVPVEQYYAATGYRYDDPNFSVLFIALYAERMKL
jgi:hypothetical protein